MSTKRSRPILFSTPMVKSLRDGEKTMTRRKIEINPEEWEFVRIAATKLGTFAVFKNKNRGTFTSVKFRCGNIGDGLWVKETYTITGHGVKYRADGELSAVKWKSSMFMPKKYSRTNL